MEVPHIPSAQEILDDILANNKIPSEVKAGTERLVLPEVPEGSKIEIVAVNPEGIIGLDGKVTTPENDTDVIVTIQVTDTNGATAKADVKVLVRGEKADPDDDNNGNDNNGGNDNNSVHCCFMLVHFLTVPMTHLVGKMLTTPILLPSLN